MRLTRGNRVRSVLILWLVQVTQAQYIQLDAYFPFIPAHSQATSTFTDQRERDSARFHNDCSNIGKMNELVKMLSTLNN